MFQGQETLYLHRAEFERRRERSAHEDEVRYFDEQLLQPGTVLGVTKTRHEVFHGSKRRSTAHPIEPSNYVF